jgi:hypothetical protein
VVVVAAPAPAASAPSAPSHSERPHEDDGRTIDFVFIQPEGGVSYLDMTAVSTNGRLLLPEVRGFRGTGWGGGLTVGFRWHFLAFAAHGYIGRFNGDATDTGVTGATTTPVAFDIGQLMAEVHLRIPLPIVEPYARVQFGYGWLGSFQLNERYRDSTSNVSGWTGGVGVGLDVWLGRYVTVGAGLDFTLINFRRGGIQRPDSTCPMTDPTCVELREDGDSVGVLIHGHLQAGVHF